MFHRWSREILCAAYVLVRRQCFGVHAVDGDVHHARKLVSRPALFLLVPRVSETLGQFTHTVKGRHQTGNIAQ
jgi:hypothetical protein